jgi:hypothetical protein
VGGTCDTHTKFRAESRKGRDHFGSLGVSEMMVFKCFIRNYGGRVFTGFALAGVGFNSGVLSCDTVMDLIAP